MNNTIGLIITGGRNHDLKDITAKRSISAVPYGGRYRTIDFVLSNMVNSGINKVGVVTQYSYRSLMDHIGAGKEWDLDRRRGGIYLFPPYLSGDNSGWYRGSADGIYHNLSFLKRSSEEYVLISTGNCIYNTRYDQLVDNHKESGADITIFCREVSDFAVEDLEKFGMLEVDADNRIIEMNEKPSNPKGDFASMGVYIVKRELLIDLIETGQSKGYYDFAKDIIIKNIDKLRINAFEFKGYWRPISSVRLFYKTNMELLNPEVRKELFFQNGTIFTKEKNEPPAKYNEEANVTNSIIADGCIIEGTVINSILFRGVEVGKGAVLRNCIVMQDSIIKDYATLDNVILDKEVTITVGKELKGEMEYPYLVGKRNVI